MIRNLCYCILLSSVFLSACKYKQNKETLCKKKFIKYPVEKIDNNQNRLFNLTDIDNGINDSLEIRIWPYQHLSYDARMIDIKIGNDSVYSAWVYYTKKCVQLLNDGSSIAPDGTISYEKVSFQSRQLFPVSGWKVFYDSLNRSGIMQLPTQDSIKNHPHNGGVLGESYVIEFATKNSFRRIHYYIFGADETHPECWKVFNFIAFLQKQFREDYWWPQPID
ncbi:hypothetical protein [Ferruginibacter albus]|uniref:hypothetical protein n=1 Tax=Ferruginibacter albus TaxID=2875540 RepID=UPI001CC3F1AD|nr:hypothetical protein [Ferruginibacter albus]UAY51655.1 hypothetical protein K9M53_13795 [Ferruginibacter albus]